MNIGYSVGLDLTPLACFTGCAKVMQGVQFWRIRVTAFCLFSFVLSFFALSIALLKHSRLLSSPCPMFYALCPKNLFHKDF
jgi:hypothetical protein